MDASKHFLQEMEDLAYHGVYIEEEIKKLKGKGIESAKEEVEKKPVIFTPSWLNSNKIGADLSKVNWEKLEKFVVEMGGKYEKTNTGVNVTLPNKSQLNWDTKTNQIAISKFDEETLRNTAKALKACGVETIDLSKLTDKKALSLAWQTARQEGLAVVGYQPTKEDEEKLASTKPHP
jgi:hypothetical protein